MAKTRLPTLDITPELPQVVSQDLNWFYKPEAVPVSDTYGDLAKTLDNFAKGALTKMAVADEIELQQEGEAKAKADTAKIEYDEGIKTFAEYAKKNNISNNANPYYVTEMKNLYLQNKAGQFQTYLNTEYAKNNIKDRAINEPNVFNDFYGETLKKYIVDNNLNAFDPVVMNENFFKKTDGYRNSLSATHNQSILNNADVMFQKELATHFTTTMQEHYGKKNGYDAIATAYTNKIKTMFNITGDSKVPIEYIEKGLEALIVDDTIDNNKKLEILENVVPKVLLGTGNYADTNRGALFVKEQKLKLIEKNNQELKIQFADRNYKEQIAEDNIELGVGRYQEIPDKITYLKKYINNTKNIYGRKYAIQSLNLYQGLEGDYFGEELMEYRRKGDLQGMNKHFDDNGAKYDRDTLTLFNTLKGELVNPDKNFLFTTQESSYKVFSEHLTNLKNLSSNPLDKIFTEADQKIQMANLVSVFERDVHLWSSKNKQTDKEDKATYIARFDKYLVSLIEKYKNSPDFSAVAEYIDPNNFRRLTGNEEIIKGIKETPKPDPKPSWSFMTNQNIYPKFANNVNQKMGQGYVPFGINSPNFIGEAKKALSRYDTFYTIGEGSFKLLYEKVEPKVFVLRWVKPDDFEKLKNNSQFQEVPDAVIELLQAQDLDFFNDNRFK